MEQYDNKVPRLPELTDDIKTNSEKWSLDTIHQTRQSFYSIIRHLNYVHNSKIGINKLSPDILYDIFALAVYSSSEPGTTAMNISRVSHHWRESALGWPVLWAFVALNYEPSIFNLFIKRSQNAPLTLSCGPGFKFGFIFTPLVAPSISYFIPQAYSILSRLCSLIIYTSYFNFARLNRIIQNSKCPPLRLQHLNIRLFNDACPTEDSHIAKPAPLACVIDNSCLRVIQLESLDLPKLELPHNKLLTDLSLKYINPPPLSQFLAFLSNCPSLKVLELELQDEDRHGVETIFDVTTSTNPPVDKLGFVNLTGLGLRARGTSSLDFIQRFSELIQILGTLSQFKLCYNVDPYERPEGAHLDDQQDTVTVGPISSSAPFRIFEAIRPGLLTSFSNYQYLAITIHPRRGYIKIYGDISASRHRESDNSCPLVIDYENLNLINYFPIRALVQAMPQIQHLKLGYEGWHIFTLWSNIHDAFPCLHTLELIKFVTDDLDSLPEDRGLRFKKLILESCKVSSESLLWVVVRMGVEVLEATDTEIRDRRSMTWERHTAIRAAFRERGFHDSW